MGSVASYKGATSLKTDKRINLVYGLNGAGKTTLSNFLYNRIDSKYSGCAISGLSSEKVLVYNQAFIHENFYETDSLKGIFTLSKENRIAEEAIKIAQAEIVNLEEIRARAIEKNVENKAARLRNRTDSENVVWKIKTTYAGGDRVLEYCLDNLKGKKEALFNYILAATRPQQKPKKSIDDLKKEVELLVGENANVMPLLPLIQFSGTATEENKIFESVIVGNEDSVVANLIKELGNSDWVQKGLSFIPNTIEADGAPCPFCQEKTITADVSKQIRDYFDETYDKSIQEIRRLYTEYEAAIGLIPPSEAYSSNMFLEDRLGDFEFAYSNLVRQAVENLKMIGTKGNTPSQIVRLKNTNDLAEAINLILSSINQKIQEHNVKINKKTESLAQIKFEFWSIMRWDYDQTISKYNSEVIRLDNNDKLLNQQILDHEKEIDSQKLVISTNQNNTVNIVEAVDNINTGLSELGIDGFYITKYQDKHYKISRNGNSERTFHTLSEGEKMIISFLYFRELCKGRGDALEPEYKKILVIDDPISSLSHIYVFNVGRLIKKTFFESNEFEQVFVLTHSLYFFYELTETNHDKRKESQKLFRLIKNASGSQIIEMKYEEIQNDYQAYWHIVKDENQPPALIANCMRNIIEYFFNFIEKRDLNNVFRATELQSHRFQAFYRFINRESHSLGQNIFDYKEFDYTDFKDALELVFEVSGYESHYQKMMKK